MITSGDMAPYTQFLLETPVTSDYAFYLLYLTIFVLSIIVYKLGFARKLPVLKSLIVYVIMAVGCFIMAILSLLIPITGSLFFSAIVLGIYKIRLRASQKRDETNRQA